MNNPIKKLKLTTIYRTSHPTTAEIILFSSAHGKFIKTYYQLSTNFKS